MKTIIVHTHRTVNYYPRKHKKNTEPTQEQMLVVLNKQIEYHEEQIKMYKAIIEKVQLGEEILPINQHFNKE